MFDVESYTLDEGDKNPEKVMNYYRGAEIKNVVIPFNEPEKKVLIMGYTGK